MLLRDVRPTDDVIDLELLGLSSAFIRLVQEARRRFWGRFYETVSAEVGK
jgi:hypothetical protein